MFFLKRKVSIYITLIILLIAFPLIKIVNAEDIDTYDLYKIKNHNTIYNLSDNIYSIQFNAATSFDYLQLYIIGDSNVGSITLSLYKWDSDSRTTLKSTPLYTKDYYNWNNNDWLTFNLNDFGLSEQEPGEYLFSAFSKAEDANVRVYRPALHDTRTYMNEFSIYGSLQTRIHFTKQSSNPLDVISDNDKLALNTPPPKSSLSKEDPIIKLNVDSTQWDSYRWSWKNITYI